MKSYAKFSFRISPARARAAGFTTRPLRETARDAWASYQKIVPADLVYPQKQYGFEWESHPNASVKSSLPGSKKRPAIPDHPMPE
jgi:hypothetical protein